MLSEWLEWAVVAVPIIVGLMQWVIPIREPKRSHRVSVLIGCILFSVLIWWQQRAARQEHSLEIANLPTREQLTKLNDRLEKSEKERNRLLLNLTSKTPLLDALEPIARGTPLPIEESATLTLDASKSALDDWRLQTQAQDQRSHLNSIQFWETATKQCSPVFDYAITTLSSFVATLAKDNGDTASSTYKGMPSVIMPDRELKDYAVIGMDKNKDWRFAISLSSRSQKEFKISILCGRQENASNAISASFEFMPNSEAPFASHLIISGKESFNLSYTAGSEDYKPKINYLLKLMIAAQQELHPITNGARVRQP